MDDNFQHTVSFHSEVPLFQADHVRREAYNKKVAEENEKQESSKRVAEENEKQQNTNKKPAEENEEQQETKETKETGDVENVLADNLQSQSIDQNWTFSEFVN